MISLAVTSQRFAALAAVTVVTVSTKWERLPMELTATMMESYLPDSGSSKMKSTLMTSQRSSGIRSGWSSLVGRRRCILVRRHKSQWETYMPTYRD